MPRKSVAPVRASARPALLELVDDDDHAAERRAMSASIDRTSPQSCFGRAPTTSRQRGSQCPTVVTRDHRDDDVAPVRAGDETGAHHRALPRPGRSDDGDERPRVDQRSAGRDRRVAAENRLVGLVERAQALVGVDAGGGRLARDGRRRPVPTRRRRAGRCRRARRRPRHADPSTSSAAERNRRCVAVAWRARRLRPSGTAGTARR